MNLLVPGVALLGVLVLAGAGLFLMLIDQRQQRRDIDGRISLVAGGGARVRVLAGAGAPGSRRSPDFMDQLRITLIGLCAWRLPNRWGMTAGAPMLLAVGALGGGLMWAMLHEGLHMPNWVALAGAAVVLFFAPRLWLKRQQGGAEQLFMEAFPGAIDMVIRMLRAGLPVTAAVRLVGDEAPDAVSQVFTRIADQMAIGMNFEDALRAASRYIGLADFQFFAVAITLQRATGGNLITTLDILADIMRKRRAVRAKAKATTGEVRMSAYVLGAIPFLVIGALLVTTPNYLRPLITDRRGNIIIVMAVLSLAAGFGTIRQMMRSVTHGS
jgi:tight adherence protein B